MHRVELDKIEHTNYQLLSINQISAGDENKLTAMGRFMEDQNEIYCVGKPGKSVDIPRYAIKYWRDPPDLPH